MASRESWRDVDEALFPASDPTRPIQDVQSRHPLSKLQAWTLVLGGYAAMFGLGVWTGIGRMLDRNFTTGITDGGWIAFNVFQMAVLVVIVTLLCRWSGLRLTDLGLKIPRTRSQLWLEVRTGSMGGAASILGFLIAGFVNILVYGDTMAYPSTVHTTPAEWINDILGSIVAGPTEEILLVVVLVFALRAAGYSWSTVFITGTVLRILFHLYYGWPIVLAAVWPLLVILLYKRTRAIWGIIIAHSWFDVIGSLVIQLSLEGQDELAGLLTFAKVAPAAFGVAYIIIMRRRYRKVPKAT